MSSNITTPYDEERTRLGMLVESVEEPESDAGSDTASECVLEHLLELLSVDGFAYDDADITSDLARPSTSEQEILEWQWDIFATSLTASYIHTARAPVHLQAERSTERMHQLHEVFGLDCWIGLSVGWPQTDVSFEHFGMVHGSHSPYVNISSQYMLGRNILYPRTPLGSLNGVPEYDTAEPGTLFYPDSLLPLPSL